MVLSVGGFVFLFSCFLKLWVYEGNMMLVHVCATGEGGGKEE